MDTTSFHRARHSKFLFGFLETKREITAYGIGTLLSARPHKPHVQVVEAGEKWLVRKTVGAIVWTQYVSQSTSLN